MAARQRILDEAEPAASGVTGHRLCAVTRADVDPDHLIRFVADPDGNVVPDLQRRLPGRGVWISGERSVVARAVAEKAFSKSLKRQVKADPSLADLVDQLLLKRVLDVLSLANKAGLITAGYQQVFAAVEGGQAKALLHGSDAADGGRDKLNRKYLAVTLAKGGKPVVITSLSTEQLSLSIGRSNVVHAALIQGGLTQRFLGEAERLQRYRSGSCAFQGPGDLDGLEV